MRLVLLLDIGLCSTTSVSVGALGCGETVCFQAGATQLMPSTDQTQRLSTASIKLRWIKQTQPVFTAVHLRVETLAVCNKHILTTCIFFMKLN